MLTHFRVLAHRVSGNMINPSSGQVLILIFGIEIQRGLNRGYYLRLEEHDSS